VLRKAHRGLFEIDRLQMLLRKLRDHGNHLEQTPFNWFREKYQAVLASDPSFGNSHQKSIDVNVLSFLGISRHARL